MADEIHKIEQSFQTMRDTLNAQIASANELKNILSVQNEQLVGLADDATKKIATMSGRLDNTVAGLGEIVASQSWADVENSTDRFSSSVIGILARIDETTRETTDRTAQIQTQIDSWIESGKTLSEYLQNEFNTNAEQMKTIATESEATQGKLSELAKSVSDGFGDVKSAAVNYEDIMIRNDRLLDGYLDKLDAFSNQSKKQSSSKKIIMTEIIY